MNRSKHILIVDDSTHFRQALKALIMEIDNHCKVTQASTGNEMLSLLNTIQFDVAFIDIRMQGLSGIETTEIAHELQPNLNIIGFSTLEGCDYIASFLNAGAKGYLSKNKNNYQLIKNIITNTYVDFVFSEGLDTNCLVNQTTQNISTNIK